MTESQRIWLHCQLLLDDGAQICALCEHVDVGAFCRQCGTARVASGTLQICPQCHLQGQGRYCIHCGAALLHELEEEIQADPETFWAAWEARLTPHLGGLTDRERAMLQRQGAQLGTASGS